MKGELIMNYLSTRRFDTSKDAMKEMMLNYGLKHYLIFFAFWTVCFTFLLGSSIDISINSPNDVEVWKIICIFRTLLGLAALFVLIITLYLIAKLINKEIKFKDMLNVYIATFIKSLGMIIPAMIAIGILVLIWAIPSITRIEGPLVQIFNYVILGIIGLFILGLGIFIYWAHDSAYKVIFPNSTFMVRSIIIIYSIIFVYYLNWEVITRVIEKIYRSLVA